MHSSLEREGEVKGATLQRLGEGEGVRDREPPFLDVDTENVYN